MSEEKTMLKVSKKVRDRLKKIGKKGQTYTKIIEKLLDREERIRGSKEKSLKEVRIADLGQQSRDTEKHSRERDEAILEMLVEE